VSAAALLDLMMMDTHRLAQGRVAVLAGTRRGGVDMPAASVAARSRRTMVVAPAMAHAGAFGFAGMSGRRRVTVPVMAVTAFRRGHRGGSVVMVAHGRRRRGGRGMVTVMMMNPRLGRRGAESGQGAGEYQHQEGPDG
jgi:hypothetical protein